MKKCIICLNDIPATKEHFYVNTRNPDGLDNSCKKCRKSGKTLRKRQGKTIPESVLLKRFIVPPFTVLDAKQGYWQDRKKTWKKLGIIGEAGRATNMMRVGKLANIHGKGFTSTFDPVLCEILYYWFCPTEGKIFDPFAGGSTRGLVAAFLGYKYVGIDINPDQIRENRKQASTIKCPQDPKWICGDSDKSLSDVPNNCFDFLFSCPPYFNTERYTNIDGDLSRISSFQEFLRKYARIVAKSLQMLKENRFACFVVSNIRDRNGFELDFTSETKRIFSDHSAFLYNQGVLLTSLTSLPMRVGKQFSKSRKMGRAHQNILIFYKGDPSKIWELN